MRAMSLALVVLVVAGVGRAAETLPLDAIVEDAAAWVDGTPERVFASVDDTYTHATAAALRLDWPKDLGDIAGTGIPKTPQLPRIWLRLPDDLDLSRYTRLTYWARIAGTRHGHLHVGFSSEQKIWGEGVLRTFNNTPLDAGQWRQYVVTIGHVPPEERRQYKWLLVASINVGHQPDEEPVMRVWLDDWALDDAPLRKTEGWEADPTVVICSQAGFRSLQEKTALVAGDNPATEFTVVGADDGREVFRGQLEGVRCALGNYRVADFTDLTRPGRYRVRVGELQSPAFSIGPDAWTPLKELLGDWVFNMRCGCATGLHSPCHLDDITFVRYEGEGNQRRELSRLHMDAVGGWHDAGDVRTYYMYTYRMGYLALMTRANGWRHDRDGDGRDDMLDEALWAMRHLPKVVNPDTGELLPKIEDWPDYRRGNYWTDCIIGNADDRHVMVQPEDVDLVGRAIASAALFARVAGDDYPEVAQAALRVALDRWRVWFDPEVGKKRWREGPIHVHGHGYHIAKWGQGALQLYLLTGEPVYLQFAKVCADHIMGYQRRTFYSGSRMCGEIFSWHKPLPDRDLPEEYLADLMIELPSDPDYYRWRATLVRAAQWWMKPTRANWGPFSLPHLETAVKDLPERWSGVPLETAPDGTVLRYLIPTTGPQLVDTPFALQRVAQALGDVALERLARGQVQWTVGHNPFGVSWVCEFGEDNTDQFYSFSQGIMPGCVAQFGIGDDGIPRCVRPNNGEPVTILGMRLLRSLAACTEPARLRLSVTRGGRPWQGPVAIQWYPRLLPVSSGQTDAQGRLEVELDGGNSYRLDFGQAHTVCPLISGTTRELRVDLDRLISLQAQAPPAAAGAQFIAELSVVNSGLAAAQVTVRVYAEDATPTETEKTVRVAAQDQVVVPWTFTAGEGGRPYVLIFEADGDRAIIVDATAEIR